MMTTPKLAGWIKLSALTGAAVLAGCFAHPAAGQARPRVPRPHDQPQPIVRFVPESVTLYGGQGFNRQADGIPATDAQFGNLFGIALDSQGNLYLADANFNLIRRINAADGTITTVAGSYSGGGGERKPTRRPRDVSGTDLFLSSPRAVAVDSHDLLYFTDTYNNVVYRLDPATNFVTVVAGTPGYSGFSPDGTPATSALLNAPAGLAVDAAGNVYIADTGNNVVRRVNASDGTLVTFAGDQSQGAGYTPPGSPATQALLNNPNGLAFDKQGNLLIADTYNCVVRKVDLTTQTITNVAGNHTCGFGGDSGLATDASTEGAYQIAVDAVGQLYIGGTSTGVVHRVDLNGYIATIAGLFDPSQFPSSPGFDGPSTQFVFGEVNGVAVDPQGSIYLVGIYGSAIFRTGPGALMAFGQVQKGSPATQNLTVENLGAAPLSITGFSIQGTGFTAASAATGGCGTTLASGAHCDLAITFSPTDTITYNATLTLTDNAPDSVQVIPLSGTGILAQSVTQETLSSDHATTGDTVNFAANVAAQSGSGPVPTGTITFTDDNTGNVLATATLDPAGNASVNVSTLTAGYYYVIANYPGDANYQPSTSLGANLTINAQTAAITLTTTPTTATAGATITASAQITSRGAAPTGTVEFRLDGTAVASASIQTGAANATFSAPNPGDHTLQAVYLGSATYAPAFSNTVSLTTHGALLQFTPGSSITLAGTPSDDLHGGFGGDGGPATSAYLHTAYGVTADKAGNVYIADEENNVIRKVTPTGIISTVAGVPYAASIYYTRYSGDGGYATNAYLDHPTAVLVDGVGNLYIADYSNNVIRKVTAATGIITTIAGNYYGSGVYNGDHTALATQLSHPGALALDSAGNLYIADTGNNLVRKLDTGGNITTIAGNYYTQHGRLLSGVAATSTDLYSPFGIALDHAGNLYISDTSYNAIRKVDLSGIITTIAGGGGAAGDNVPAISASLNNPHQIAFDPAGNLYIAESGNGIIRKIDTAGILSTPLGFYGSSSSPWSHFDPAGLPSTYFQLQSPSSVAVGPDGSLYAADTYNQTIIRSGPAGALVFGPQAGGTTSAAQTLTLSNVGDSPLTFAATPYNVTGDYLVTAGTTNGCNFTSSLPSGAACTVSVSHKNQTGTNTGTIVFSTNVLGTPTVLLTSNTTTVPTATTLYMPGSSATVGDNLLFLGIVSAQGPAPQGSVGFYDGATLLGTAPIGNGYAAFYYSGLTVGTHTITARYVSDGYYAVSTSDPGTITINPTTGGGGGGGDTTGLDYSIQVSGAPLVLHRGETGTVTLFYTPLNSYSGNIALSCGTLPAYATCSFSPAMLSLSQSQQQSVVLTITTTALPATAHSRPATIRLAGTPVVTLRK